MEIVPRSKKAVEGSLLDKTLAAAVKDRQMVTTEGDTVETLPLGVSFHAVPTHQRFSRHRCRALRYSLAMAPRSLGFRLLFHPPTGLRERLEPAQIA